jgi:multidrug efflux pump subunit AcrA (membrane-fusion protein)
MKNKQQVFCTGFALLAITIMMTLLAVKAQADTTLPALTVNTGSPVRQVWPLKLVANGNIAPWKEAVISSESGGLKIKSIEVTVGDLVKKDQVLAGFTNASQIKSPDDGLIIASSATLGAVVAPGQELFRLIRKNRLEWQAQVMAQDLSKIKVKDAVEVKPSGLSPVKGTVRMIAPVVDPKTRTTLVYVDISSDGEVKSGMFASGEFLLGSSEAMTVPEKAVVVRDGFSYVFAVTNDSHVKQIKVETGRRMNAQIEILQGLSENDSLVVTGVGFLNDGDLVSVQPAPVNAVTPDKL